MVKSYTISTCGRLLCKYEIEPANGIVQFPQKIYLFNDIDISEIEKGGDWRRRISREVANEQRNRSIDATS